MSSGSWCSPWAGFPGLSPPGPTSSAQPRELEMASLTYSECMENHNRLMRIWVFTAYSHHGEIDIRKVHDRNLMYFPECK